MIIHFPTYEYLDDLGANTLKVNDITQTIVAGDQFEIWIEGETTPISGGPKGTIHFGDKEDVVGIGYPRSTRIEIRDM